MNIIIIGAGIGGLGAANLLAKDGHTVTVLEKNDYLGGRAGKLQKDGFTFDTGPSWYLMPGVFDRYFKELGTSAGEQLNLIKLSPAYKVYGHGQDITVSGDIAQDAASFDKIQPGAGQALHSYVKKSSEVYRLALNHFLYSNFENLKPFLNGPVLSRSLTMLSLMNTPLHTHVQKSFSHPLLQQVMEYPSVFLGSSPFTAPALYSLMSSLDFEEGVYYPRGTMYAVVESLVKLGNSLGVTYKTNTDVTEILVEEGSARGVKLASGETLTADIVISGADLHFTETKLLKPEHQSYPEGHWKKLEPSPSALLMFLGVKGSIPEFEHHTLLFTDDWERNFEAIFETKQAPSPASLYISKTSASEATAPEGHENIFVLVPFPAGVSVESEQLETLADSYLEQIKQTTGVDLKTRTISRTLFGPSDFASKYNSWNNSMLGPSHLLRQSAFFRTPNKSKRVRNLFYVGAGTVPGVGVPMCLISAQLVRERVQKLARKERA